VDKVTRDVRRRARALLDEKERIGVSYATLADAVKRDVKSVYQTLNNQPAAIPMDRAKMLDDIERALTAMTADA